jgi:hypothetical protein
MRIAWQTKNMEIALKIKSVPTKTSTAHAAELLTPARTTVPSNSEIVPFASIHCRF